MGRKTTTTGVLFITADIAPTITMIATSARRSPCAATRCIKDPTADTAPLDTSARETTNMPATVITAGFPNPASASFGSRTPRTPSATGTSSAVTSIGIHSVTNSRKATPRTSSVVTWS